MPRQSKAKKFTIGEFVTDPQQVIDAAKSGRWIWFGTDRYARVYSATWISNMNFGCVMNYIARKQLSFAVRNPEFPYVFKARFMEAIPSVSKNSEWWATCSEIPSARISEITKDSVINSACIAAMQHVGGDAKVHVVFEVPEHKTAAVKLLAP